jgi:hypothetical protein|tara:strand:- start:2923 stop:3651 length:729 start_codon:yes stop_codon:yes gene_type:complete
MVNKEHPYPTIDGEAMRKKVKNAAEIASVFTDVVEEKRWWTSFTGYSNRHLTIEAWIFLAVELYGYIPRITHVKQLPEEDVGTGFAVAYEAQAELIKIDSQGNEIVLARGFNSAGTFEDNFPNKKGYATLSMAQTRALSKTISSYFRSIPPMAGFSGTPADEMANKEDADNKKAVYKAPASAPATSPPPLDYPDSSAPEDIPDVKCDLCGSDMKLRTGEYGKFLGCSNYPDCKNTKQLKQTT